jgi:hypothetical protein
MDQAGAPLPEVIAARTRMIRAAKPRSTDDLDVVG